MAQQKTSLDIWFSYAGEQQPLVTSIVDCMTKNEDELRETVFNLDDETDFTALKGVRFLPKRYKSEDEKNKPHFRLPPGGDINALVEDIGKSFLKVIVLSEEYFKSYVCMQELCLSLCSFHIDREVFPLFLLVGFEGENKLSAKKKFNFELGEGADFEYLTLFDALCTIHKQLNQASWQSLRGFNIPHSKENFKKTLQDLLFNDLENGSTKNICKLSATEESCDASLTQGVFDYCYNKLKKLESYFQVQMADKLYENWLSSDYTKRLVEFQKNDNGNIIEFKHISSITDAMNYLKQLETAVKKLYLERTDISTKSFSSVLDLVGLVALKLIPSVDAALYSYFGGTNAVINIQVRSKGATSFTTALQAAIAFSASIKTGVKFNLVKGTEPAIEDIKGVILGERFSIAGEQGNQRSPEPEYLLRELARKFLPGMKSDSENLSVFEDSRLLRKLNFAICAFEDAYRKNYASSLESSKYAVIAFKKLLNESSHSINALIAKIEQAINEESDRAAKVPYIVITEHSDPSKATNFSVKMSQDISIAIEDMLNGISLVLQGKSA